MANELLDLSDLNPRWLPENQSASVSGLCVPLLPYTKFEVQNPNSFEGNVNENLF